MKKHRIFTIFLLSLALLSNCTALFAKQKKIIHKIILKPEKKHRDFNERHKGPHESRRLKK